MADASFTQTSFLGGAVSKSMQGRIDHPAYRSWMNVCLNSFPMEQGAWVRRPGTRFASTTRGGATGRIVTFDFKQAAPYVMEFTAGYLRFLTGYSLVMTNDEQAVVGISSANPAVVEVAAAWATGESVAFSALGANNPLLQNRVFSITNVDGTHFSLQDSITGADIDGATLGTFVSGTVSRVYEMATPYVGTLWETLRSVQADIPTRNATTPGAVFLHAQVKPYVLQVETPPTADDFATFSLAAAVFKDGPYFDPVPGGTLATPSALIGNITITLSFSAYDATKPYSVGDYVTSSSVNYKSLTDANVGNTPVSSPSNWVAVSAADAIGPNGFQGSDVGRHIRLYSEPPDWVVGGSYTAGTSIVKFDGVYWKCLTNNTGASTNTPSTSPTIWALYAAGARWTWGRITGLSNIIDRSLAGSASIGDMSSGGGLAALFDGNFTQIASASAEKTVTGGPTLPTTITLSSYGGKNYSAASDQSIASVTVYPSTDQGLAFGTYQGNLVVVPLVPTITLNLRGKATLPASASDGTLLGTSGPISNVTAPVTVVSSDQTTAWKYVWVEQITTAPVYNNYSLTNAICEISFFSPPGSGVSQGVTVQIVGDALLYTTAVRTWRLGLYSDTTGWPTCGTYLEGRLWLSGVIANRVDASKSNEIFNFAPTNPDGSVAGNNAIAYTFNAPDINPILWMVPDYNGLVCGTQAGEWLVQATTQNLPLTPTTIQARRVTTNQCANIEPRRTDLTLAVAQSHRRELLEYFADVYSGKFTASDLTESGKHLTKGLISEIAYQQELAPVLWSRMADGSFAGCTYKRRSLVSSQPAEIRGWHPHELGSERTVESICIAGIEDGTLPALAMVTNDADTDVRHVEIMTKMIEEGDDLGDMWLLDDAVAPSSTSSDETPVSGAPYGGLTINGLWHLNDQMVQVFAGGLDCGERTQNASSYTDFTVTNGSIFVPYGDGISAGSGAGLFTAAFAASGINIVVGHTYTSDGQIVRPATPAESGARNGPATGKLRRVHKVAFTLVNSCGLRFGTDFAKLDPLPLRVWDGGPVITPLQTFTGVVRSEPRDDDTFDGMVCWRVARPKPAMVTSVSGFLHSKDI